MKIFQPIWTKILLALLVIALLGYYGVNPLLNQLLKRQVESKLIGNFFYKYDTIQVDIFSRSVVLKNVTWQFPKDSSQLKHKGSIKEFAVSGISWLSVFGALSVNEIKIKRPSFNTQIQVNKLLNTKSDTAKLSQFNFYSLIKGKLESVEVDHIKVDNASAKWYSPDFKSVWREVNSGFLEIHGFHIDSITSAKNNGLFGLKDFNLKFNDAKIFLPDSLHKIELGTTAINFIERSISIDSLKLSPLISNSTLAKKFTYEKTSIELTIPQLTIEQIDFPLLFSKQQLNINKIGIKNMQLLAFKDKHAIEPTFKRPPLPQAALQELSKIIYIDSVVIVNASIVYSQKAKQSDKIGKVDFDYLNGSIAHITNDSIKLIKNPYAVFKFKTLVFNQSTLDGVIQFEQNSKVHAHTVKGSLQPINLIHANKVLVPLKAYAIRSGQLNSFEFDMALNNNKSSGALNFTYDKLKIDRLDTKTLKKGNLDDKLFSMLANGLAIQNSNPDWKGYQKEGEIDFERVLYKSIFHYWWYSLLSGIKSIMLNAE